MATSFIGQSGLPLGLRNNNPGDFRTGIAWQGMTGSQNGFITFQDVTWGLRALALDLINNISKEGYNTISLFITKYAPPSENDTAGYIASVSQFTSLDPNEVLGTDTDTLFSMMRAIMNKELGANYSAMVPDQDLLTGISMAEGGAAATLPAALAIAAQNPGAYVSAVTPLEWGGLAAAVVLVVYLLKRKS